MVCASCGRHIALVQHIVSVGRREFAERVMGVVVVKEKTIHKFVIAMKRYAVHYY